MNTFICQQGRGIDREYEHRQTLQATKSHAHNDKISDEQSQPQSMMT